MSSNRDNCMYHSLVLTEKRPLNFTRFQEKVKRDLFSQLGDDFHIEYVHELQEDIRNLNACLDYVEKKYGKLDDSTTFKIKRKTLNEQKIVYLSWKNKKRLINRIFS